jgi:hypothetical protein
MICEHCGCRIIRPSSKPGICAACDYLKSSTSQVLSSPSNTLLENPARGYLTGALKRMDSRHETTRDHGKRVAVCLTLAHNQGNQRKAGSTPAASNNFNSGNCKSADPILDTPHTIAVAKICGFTAAPAANFPPHGHEGARMHLRGSF